MMQQMSERKSFKHRSDDISTSNFLLLTRNIQNEIHHHRRKSLAESFNLQFFPLESIERPAAVSHKIHTLI